MHKWRGFFIQIFESSKQSNRICGENNVCQHTEVATYRFAKEFNCLPSAQHLQSNVSFFLFLILFCFYQNGKQLENL